MIEYRVDINLHLFFGEVVNQLQISISDGIHKRIPIVRCGELIY